MQAMVTAICIVSIAIAAVEGLTSGTALKGQMKFILSLAFITVFIVPIAKKDVGFSLSPIEDFFESDSFKDAEDVYNQSLKEQICLHLRSAILEEFAVEGITCEKLEIYINISETNSIDIIKAVISTKQTSEAEAIIKKNLGEGTIIEYEAD